MIVAEAPQAKACCDRLQRFDGNSRPGRDVVQRRGAEAAEVPADQVLQAVLFGHRARPQPVLGGRKQIRTPSFPRARRRHANELAPEPDEAFGQIAELLDAPRSVVEGGAELRVPTCEPAAACTLVGLRHPLAHRRSDSRDVEPVVACGDGVNRGAHERSLDDRPPLEGARQLLAPEAAQAGPEADVRVRRVLVLDPRQALQRARDWQSRALQQQLAREQSPVQLPLGEDALATRRS